MKIKIVSRPDTDEIEDKMSEFYSKLENLTFVECPECEKKPGSPTLCQSCFHNRTVISMLHGRLKGRSSDK